MKSHWWVRDGSTSYLTLHSRFYLCEDSVQLLWWDTEATTLATLDIELLTSQLETRRSNNCHFLPPPLLFCRQIDSSMGKERFMTAVYS